VNWECHDAKWYEDIRGMEEPNFGIRLEQEDFFSKGFPLFQEYGTLVRDYNSRNFTYPEDVFAAFSGITTALSRTFPSGFLCGLPEMFFDISLLWQPAEPLERKVPSGNSTFQSSIPSWSWAGWRGSIDVLSWFHGGSDYIKRGTNRQGNRTFQRTFPFIQFYCRNQLESPKRQILSTWNTFSSLTHETETAVPAGWTRYETGQDQDEIVRQTAGRFPYLGVGLYYFKHESDTNVEFWYPIPLADLEGAPIIRSPAAWLSFRTQRTWLCVGEDVSIYRPCVSVRDNSGPWAGILNPHNEQDLALLLRDAGPFPRKPIIELIAISRGSAYNARYGTSLDEWRLEERPKSFENYEYFNVLWIEWDDGIAYRKALGRIVMEIWERQVLELVDVTLR
jgi:hypothetical protein